MKQGIKYYIALLFAVGSIFVMYYAYQFIIKENNSYLAPKLLSFSPIPTLNDKNVQWNDSDCQGKVLCLVSPKRNDTLCIGQPADIRWDAPADMKTVNIQLRETTENANVYGMATVHASSSDLEYPGRGHFTWKVGETIEPFGGIEAGRTYTFFIFGKYKNSTLQDRDDSRIITIRRCN